MRRLLTCAAAALLLGGSSMLPPTAAAAQELALAARSPRFLLAARPGDGEPVEVSPARVATLRHRVTLDLRDVRLGAALDAIARQTGIRFTYVHGALPVDSVVQLRAEGLSVAAALTELLLGTPVDVLVNGTNQVVLVRAAERAAPGSVSGRVRDAKTGAGIVGAEVTLEGTRARAVAGEDGRYRLADVAPGSYTLVARRLGYTPGRVRVTVAEGEEVAVDVALEGRTSALDEVVVTGTMVPTEVKAVPTPITVITAEDIERQQIRTYGQLLRQVVPGMIALEDGLIPDLGSVRVRGAGSLDNPEMKVYIDGVQVSQNYYAQVDPQSIERIEVIRGPQAAAMYGSDAIGGVVEIFTKRGDPSLQDLQGSVQASLGAIESDFRSAAVLRQDYRAEVRGASGNASFNLGGGISRDGEWIDHFSLERPSLYGGMRFEQGKIGVDLTARFYGQNYHSPFDPRLAATGVSAFQNPTFLRFKGREETYGAQLQYRTAPNWDHRLIIGADRYSRANETYRPRLRTPGDTLLGFVEQWTHRLSLAYRSSLTLQPSDIFSAVFTAGVDHNVFRSAFFNFSGTSNLIGSIGTVPTTRATASRDRSSNTGYFAQAQVGYRDALFVTGSARFERNSNFGENIQTPVSPRIGVSFVQALGETTLKLRTAYGEALRAPTFEQRVGSRSQFAIIEANPDLRPERQSGPEIGADLVFGNSTSLGLTYYRQTARDLISFVHLAPIDGICVARHQNVGRVRNEGLEFEGRVSLGEVQLTGQYAYTSSRILDPGPDYTGVERLGEQISFVPKHTAGATVAVAPSQRLGLAAGVVYVGSRHEVDWMQYYRCLGGTGVCGDFLESGDMRAFWGRIPGFAKANSTLSYELATRITSYLAIENLTGSGSIEAGSTTALPGRITTVGLRIRY